jgi:hypothetical protein
LCPESKKVTFKCTIQYFWYCLEQDITKEEMSP